MCFIGIFLGENIINTFSESCSAVLLTKWLFAYVLSANNQHLCLDINKVYEKGVAKLGSLVTYTAYTNKFTIGQLKLGLDL